MGKKKGKKKGPQPLVIVIDESQRENLRDALMRLAEDVKKNAQEDLAKFFSARHVNGVTDSYDNKHAESFHNLIFGEGMSRFDDDMKWWFGDHLNIELRTPEEHEVIVAKTAKTAKKGKKGTKKTEAPKADVASSDSPSDSGDSDCGQ